MLRKPLMILAIALLLVLAALTVLVPFLHEALLLFALYLMATEFETGPRLIARAHGSRWAPRALGEFDDLTNPAK